VFSALDVGVNFTPVLEGSALALDLNHVLKPLAFGFLVAVLVIGLGGQTGFALNPARDFGPRLMHALLPIHGKGNSRWYYAWVPVSAPIAGGMMGGSFFKLYYDGQFSIFQIIGLALALGVLGFA
ncbi:MAG: aquaporin, partial [Rothia sp. (in: high G+C Gram-positive bacteria)]|nr:aquaporin [Rothia sp. (in: high G+C Gram-positive bacteria)]